MPARNRTRLLLFGAALPAALALGLVALAGLEAERAGFEAQRTEAARGALEGAAARFTGHLERRLREALQRARDAHTTGELARLAPVDLPHVQVVLQDDAGQRLWPLRAEWLELDRALADSSFAVRQALTHAVAGGGDDLPSRQLVEDLAGWERATSERALARFRLAQQAGDWSGLDEADLAQLPSAVRFHVLDSRVREAVRRERTEEAELALRALEASFCPLRLDDAAPAAAWLRALLVELDAALPGARAEHAERAAAWRAAYAWVDAQGALLGNALARATPAGRFEVLHESSLPALALSWNTTSGVVHALAALDEAEQRRELALLARELAPRCEAPRVVSRAVAARASSNEIAAALPGFGAEPLLLAHLRREGAAFPWRTALAGGFLALCFTLALLGLSLASRSVRRERAAVDERSEFLARVSHQLKTPVANLRLFAETLASGRAREPEDVQKMQAILGLEAERLGDYLQRVLSLARLDETALLLAEEHIDTRALLEAQRARWTLAAARRGVALELAWPQALPPLRGDERALEDALTNVVDNALRLTRAGGRVRVDVAREGETLALRVVDEGAGISPEEQERVFERFAQLGGERRAAGEGTGLGLWIAREGARRAGGTLVVEHSSERGSTFLFRLPIRAEAS